MMINMSLSSYDDASSSTANLEGFFNQPSKYPEIALMKSTMALNQTLYGDSIPKLKPFFIKYHTEGIVYF